MPAPLHQLINIRFLDGKIISFFVECLKVDVVVGPATWSIEWRLELCVKLVYQAPVGAGEGTREGQVVSEKHH